jgi:TatD DNase family protein
MQDLAYKVGDSLYLNITNRCTNECSFCIRNMTRLFDQKYRLWLEGEPSAKEVLEAIGDAAGYKQIVFCGYGEPLVRLDLVKEVAAKLKAKGKRPKAKGPRPKVRIDTNGHANLFWGRNILPELKGLIDIISISLDAQDAGTYERLCRPLLGKNAYPAVIDFIKESKKYIPEVEATVVDLPAVDKEACKRIAKNLGVGFRVRSFYKETYVR